MPHEPPEKTQAGLAPQVVADAVGSQGEGPQLEPVGVLVQAHLAAVQAASEAYEQSLGAQAPVEVFQAH